jgi:hypothetical protein
VDASKRRPALFKETGLADHAQWSGDRTRGRTYLAYTPKRLHQKPNRGSTVRDASTVGNPNPPTRH